MRVYHDQDANLNVLEGRRIAVIGSGSQRRAQALNLRDSGLPVISHTSQYGSMSRGMRFMLPELRAKMREGLGEIRSGRFAREWAAEQEAGCPMLEGLRQAARSLPLYQLE